MVIKLIMSQPQSSNSTDQKSIVAQRHTVKEDCLACRLISGGGLIGISVYTYSQARKHPKACICIFRRNKNQLNRST